MGKAWLEAVSQSKPGPFRPGQAKGVAQERLWPGLGQLKATALKLDQVTQSLNFVDYVPQ